MSKLFRPIRQRIQNLLLGTYGTNVKLEPGRFKTCSQDTTPETVPPNDCERKFRIVFTEFEELEPWNSLNVHVFHKVKFNIVISYQYTKGGMFEEEQGGFEETSGNGDHDAVHERAFTDAHDIMRTLTFHENFGMLQASPLVEVFSFHPSDGGNSLELFSDRAILTYSLEAYVKTLTSLSYASV